MWTITEIAKREGITKQAVSKNVRKLLARGLRIERNSRGEVGGVDVAQYYHLQGKQFGPQQEPSRPGLSIDACVAGLTLLIDRLPLHSSEVASAVARHGEVGASIALKAMAFDLKNELLEMRRKIEVTLGHAHRRLT